MPARLSFMKIIHQGKERTRHVYFAADFAFILIADCHWKMEKISPGIYQATEQMNWIDSEIAIEQAYAEKYTSYQLANLYPKPKEDIQ